MDVISFRLDLTSIQVILPNFLTNSLTQNTTWVGPFHNLLRIPAERHRIFVIIKRKITRLARARFKGKKMPNKWQREIEEQELTVCGLWKLKPITPF